MRKCLLIPSTTSGSMLIWGRGRWGVVRSSIIGIVGGSIIAVQVLVVIIGGIHADNNKKAKENDVEIPLTVGSDAVS